MARARLLLTLAALALAGGGGGWPGPRPAAARAGIGPGRCPLELGRTAFEPERMAGQWFILAGTPLLGPDLSLCPRFNLSPQRSGQEVFLNYDLSAYSSREQSFQPVSIEGVSQAIRPHRASLSLGTWRRRSSNLPFGPIFAQSIVATDYDNYAVFLVCRPVFDEQSRSFGRELAGQVWGRHRALGHETMATLTSLLTNYDIDAADIQVADQSCY